MPLTIETPRLLLRDFQDEDWPRVHAYARDPEVVRHTDWYGITRADWQAARAQA